MLIDFFIGAAIAAALVVAARSLSDERASGVYAAGLLIAALIYVGFAATRGASSKLLALEIVGVILYGVVAWTGLRISVIVLALGWAAHTLWDVLLHVHGQAGAAYTPDWYPWACGGFDLVVAIAIVERFRQRKIS